MLYFDLFRRLYFLIIYIGIVVGLSFLGVIAWFLIMSQIRKLLNWWYRRH